MPPTATVAPPTATTAPPTTGGGTGGTTTPPVTPPTTTDPPAEDPPATDPPADRPACDRPGADGRCGRYRTGCRGRHDGLGGVQARRPRARDVPRAERAEPPGEIGGLGDPDPRAREIREPLPGHDRDRARDQRRVVLGSDRCPSACVSFPGPLRQLPRAAAGAHLAQALKRLQRADQDRRAHALGLADRVQAARGSRRSGRRTPSPAARAGPPSAASRRRTRATPARSSGRPRSRRSRPAHAPCQTTQPSRSGATSRTGRS